MLDVKWAWAWCIFSFFEMNFSKSSLPRLRPDTWNTSEMCRLLDWLIFHNLRISKRPVQIFGTPVKWACRLLDWLIFLFFEMNFQSTPPPPCEMSILITWLVVFLLIEMNFQSPPPPREMSILITWLILFFLTWNFNAVKWACRLFDWFFFFRQGREMVRERRKLNYFKKKFPGCFHGTFFQSKSYFSFLSNLTAMVC